MFRSLVTPHRNNSLAEGREGVSRVLHLRRAISPAQQLSPHRSLSTVSPPKTQVVKFSYTSTNKHQHITRTQPQVYPIHHPPRVCSPVRTQPPFEMRAEPSTIIRPRHPPPAVIRVVHKHCCCVCRQCNSPSRNTENADKWEPRGKIQSASFATQTISGPGEQYTPMRIHQNRMTPSPQPQIERVQDDPPRPLKNDSMYTNTIAAHNREQHSLTNLEEFLQEPKQKDLLESTANNDVPARSDPLDVCISSLEQRVDHLLGTGTVKRRSRMLMQIVHQGGRYHRGKKDD